MLVGPVGVAHVPGPVHHARRLPETYKEAHVGAVGDAFDYGFPSGREGVGTLDGLADRGVNGNLGRGELAAEPLEDRGVLLQPGVPVGDAGDAFADLGLKGIHLFARHQAGPALRHEPLRHGRGPVPRPHDAYVDGDLVLQMIVEGVGERGVALALKLAQRPEERDELLQCRDALVADGGVG